MNASKEYIYIMSHDNTRQDKTRQDKTRHGLVTHRQDIIDKHINTPIHGSINE